MTDQKYSKPIDKLKLLTETIFEGDLSDLAKKSKIPLTTIRTIQHRLKNENVLSVSLGKWCHLVKARETALLQEGKGSLIDALLRLVEHRLFQGKDRIEDQALWKEISQALNCLIQHSQNYKIHQQNKTMPIKTLDIFPDAFKEPFYVVTGDRREIGGDRITPADLGPNASSTSDLRYLANLKLPNFKFLSDKDFVLTPFEELQKKYSEATLIIIGSPAVNHAARLINKFSLHHFDLEPSYYNEMNDLISGAWKKGTGKTKFASSPSLDKMGYFMAPEIIDKFNSEDLLQFVHDKADDISFIRNAGYPRGIIDPVYKRLRRGMNPPHNGDYGVISLAQNPFRANNDSEYPALFLAGYHLLGTCYSMHESIWGDRQNRFKSHPLGGVIKVQPKSGAGTRHDRLDAYEVKWDSAASYMPQNMLKGLKDMRDDPKSNCHLSESEINRLIKFVEGLTKTKLDNTSPECADQSAST